MYHHMKEKMQIKIRKLDDTKLQQIKVDLLKEQKQVGAAKRKSFKLAENSDSKSIINNKH